VLQTKFRGKRALDSCGISHQSLTLNHYGSDNIFPYIGGLAVKDTKKKKQKMKPLAASSSFSSSDDSNMVSKLKSAVRKRSLYHIKKS